VNIQLEAMSERVAPRMAARIEPNRDIVCRGAAHVRTGGEDLSEREKRWREYLGGIAAGNGEPLGRLYDEAAAMLYGLAMRIVGNPADADEVVVDVFEQVWRTAKNFDASRGSVWRWLTILTRSRAVDRLRAAKMRQQREQTAEPTQEHLMSDEPSPHDTSEFREQQLLIRQALSVLPSDQRRAIELAYFSELTHMEIAATLRVPLGTIKTRIRVGMDKLRTVLMQRESAMGSAS
jgi:RNA polymerase sigma-70 factor (ECF subfamily)